MSNFSAFEVIASRLELLCCLPLILCTAFYYFTFAMKPTGDFPVGVAEFEYVAHGFVMARTAQIDPTQVRVCSGTFL